MKKQRPQRKSATRRTAKGEETRTVRTAGGHETQALSPPEALSGQSAGKGHETSTRLRAGIRTQDFHLALLAFLAGVSIVAASLAIPHDFAFFELGYLFTLSIYDLVLAMLGLSVAVGMADRRTDVLAIALGFIAVVAPMLLFFDPIFHAILQSPLGHELFLIAPVAVMLAGVVLWLPSRLRRLAAPVASAVVGFSLSLFIGLDDFGIGIKEFAFSAVLGALWILLVPGLMLRPFRGAWLTIPARIIGSWLMVIAVIVTVSLYVPFSPDAPPLPDPSLPDAGADLDAPALPPLDPAIEEGILEAPDEYGSDQLNADGSGQAFGENPLLGGGRGAQP